MTPREIRAFRATLGLSVRGFAELVGATPRTVRRWEAGTLEPLELVEQLRAMLNRDPTLD